MLADSWLIISEIFGSFNCLSRAPTDSSYAQFLITRMALFCNLSRILRVVTPTCAPDRAATSEMRFEQSQIKHFTTYHLYHIMAVHPQKEQSYAQGILVTWDKGNKDILGRILVQSMQQSGLKTASWSRCLICIVDDNFNLILDIPLNKTLMPGTNIMS